MRLALISDVHGNSAALDAVLKAIAQQSTATTICAGDLVGYNWASQRAVSTIRGLGVRCVKGNHDALLLDRQAAPGGGVCGQRTTQHLAGQDLAFLHKLPLRRQFTFGGLHVSVVHGSPGDPLHEYVYPEHAAAWLDHSEAAVLVVGHSHVQFCVRCPKGTVVNPGSVGLARDGDPRAAFATLDCSSKRVRLHRIRYDATPVADRNLKHRVPHAINEHLLLGQKSPLPIMLGADYSQLLRDVAEEAGLAEVSTISARCTMQIDILHGHAPAGVLILAVLRGSTPLLYMRTGPLLTPQDGFTPGRMGANRLTLRTFRRWTWLENTELLPFSAAAVSAAARAVRNMCVLYASAAAPA